MTTRAEVLDALIAEGVEDDVAGEILDQFIDFYAAVARHNLLADTVGLPRHPDSHERRERIAIALAASRAGGDKE